MYVNIRHIVNYEATSTICETMCIRYLVMIPCKFYYLFYPAEIYFTRGRNDAIKMLM